MSKSQRLTTAEARQASPSRMSLRVLVGSLALAILVGFLLYAAFGSASAPAVDSTINQGDRK